MNEPDSNSRKNASNPSFPFEALRKCLQGVPLAKSGRMQEALDAFAGATKDDPTLASSWYNKGFVLAIEGHYEEALNNFDKAIQLDPRFFHPWNGRGFVLCNLKRYQEALDTFERAIEIDPSIAYPWAGIGNANIGLGNYEKALENFDRAIELDPEFALSWNEKALALRMKPELEATEGYSAKQCFCRAIYLRRKYPQRFPIPRSMLMDSIKQLHLPLLARQLLKEMDAENDKEYISLFEQNEKECKAPTAILVALDSYPGLTSLDKALWCGIVNYYHGNPLEAFKYFDAVDSSDEANLAGQYYLVLSLRSFLEPSDKEISFALKQAEAVLANSSRDVTVGQLYYAGLIFRLGLKWAQAAQCFARNDKHLFSLYMRHLCGPLTAPAKIDPTQPDWIEDLKSYVHSMEIATAGDGPLQP